MNTNPDQPADERPEPPPHLGMSLCVLASGSSGNCSVLVTRAAPDAPRRVVLLDAGLSPRRTGRLLLERGIRPDEVDDIVFTHLDTDHCHPGWSSAIRPGGWRARLRIHRRHLGRAERSGLLTNPTTPFDDEVVIDPSLRAHVVTLAHDALGVAAFRFEAQTETHSAHLGFATDVGHATPEMTDLLAGVDLLAIESNYCPRMQEESDRPVYLKRRIMGGSGHLSNQQAADLVRDTAPRERVVLLHLSRQCNTPEVARLVHRINDRPLVITNQFRASPWIPVAGCDSHRPARRPIAPARSLFELPARDGAAW